MRDLCRMTFKREALIRAAEIILKLHKERQHEVVAFLKINTPEALKDANHLALEMEALSVAGLVVAERLQNSLGEQL